MPGLEIAAGIGSASHGAAARRARHYHVPTGCGAWLYGIADVRNAFHFRRLALLLVATAARVTLRAPPSPDYRVVRFAIRLAD